MVDNNYNSEATLQSLIDKGVTQQDLLEFMEVLSGVKIETDSEGKPLKGFDRGTGLNKEMVADALRKLPSREFVQPSKPSGPPLDEDAVQAKEEAVTPVDPRIGEGTVFEGIDTSQDPQVGEGDARPNIQQPEVFGGIDTNQDVVTMPEGKRATAKNPQQLPPVSMESGKPQTTGEAQQLPPTTQEFNPNLNALEPEESSFSVYDDVTQGITGKEPLVRTPEGASDMARTLEQIGVGIPQEDVKKFLMSNDETPIEEGSRIVSEITNGASKAITEQKIRDATTPEEVVQAMKEANEVKPMDSGTLVALRTAGIIRKQNAEGKQFDIALNVARNNILAYEAEKISNRIWEQTGLLDAFADYGELLIPTGVVTEEYSKYEQSLSSALEQVGKAPVENQMALLSAIVDTWEKQETVIIGNSNSVLTSGRIRSLSEAILQGGLSLTEGAITQEELNEHMWTAFNGTVYLAEVKTMKDMMKGLIRFTANRVFPSSGPREINNMTAEVMAALNPNRGGENTLEFVGGTRDARIVEITESSTKELEVLSAGKNTRQFRKQLEAEKKQLGKLKDETLTSKDSEKARELSKTEKIKFKQALKRVLEEKKATLDTIEGRQKTLQGMIDEFDNAASAESQLARVEQMSRDGRLSKIEYGTGEYEVRGTVQGEFRKSARSVDTEYSLFPESMVDDVAGKGLKEATEQAGLKTEEAIDRMIPSVTGETSPVMPNINQVMDDAFEQRDITNLQLIDRPKEEIALDVGKKLQAESDGRLLLNISGSTIKSNSNPESLGDFIFLFGAKGAQGMGFKTEKGAREAGRWGLAGVPHETVKEADGWYNKVKIEHTFDAKRDVTDLYADFRKQNPLMSLIMDPARNLGEDVLSQISSVKNVNVGKVTKLINEFNRNVRSFTPQKSVDLSSALIKGSDNGEVYGTKREFAAAIGKDISAVSDDTYSSYVALRRVMDDIYTVRNNNYRNLKVSEGWKYTEIEGKGTLIKLLNKSQAKPAQVYNSVTKSMISTEEAQAIGRIGIVQDPIADATGTLTRFVVVPLDDVKPLPLTLLNKRVGHIDRGYKETGWTVSIKTPRVVDGVQEASTRTTHIVKNREEADYWAGEAISQGANKDDVVVARARENNELDAIYGESGSSSRSFRSSHTRGRGDSPLIGGDGLEAPVMGAIESIGRAVYSLQREYDANITNSLKERFLKQFDQWMKPTAKGKFDTNLDNMMDRADVPKEVSELAEQWHDYIKGLTTSQVTPVYAKIDDMVGSILKLGTPDSAKIAAEMQKLTAQVVIVGRPLYQVPQNLTQAVYVAAAYPVSGLRAVVSLPFVLKQLMSKSDNYKMLSKVLGVDETTAREVIRDIETSGLFDSVGRMDDILSMTHDGMVSFGEGTGFYAKKYGLGTAKVPFKISQKVQEDALKLVNLLAYLAEFREKVVIGKEVFNAQTKSKISWGVQKLTQTQNGMNQFKYQDAGRGYSMMFQFMQHTQKLFFDIILDPVSMAATGKNIGKTASPLATNRKKAFASLALTAMLFGPQAVLGEKGGKEFSDVMIGNLPDFEAKPELATYLTGGMLNLLAASSMEGAVDVTGAIGPAAFVDTVYGMMLEFGNIDMFGATGGLTGSVFDTARVIQALSSSTEMPTNEKAINIALEVATIVKGLGDAERAYIAGISHGWNTMEGPLKVTDDEAFFKYFNVTPTMVNRAQLDMTFSGPKWKKTESIVTGAFIEAMNRELAYMADTGNDSLADRVEVLAKYIGYAKASLGNLSGDAVESRFKSKAMGVGEATYENYFKPIINGEQGEERMQSLRVMRANATTEEAVKDLDAAIHIYGILLDAKNETNKMKEGKQ
jgi:hypothetical protein